MMSDSAAYDAWYRTDRGRWIGETEYRLLYRALALRPAETILDVGCGTGYFSRHFAQGGHPVVGIDLDPAAARFARSSQSPELVVAVADMTALPFPDRSFDCVVAVTSLCFVEDEAEAIKEIVRVARRRFPWDCSIGTVFSIARKAILPVAMLGRDGTGALR
ncbi:MAG: class I SAM-dependent methyltransferase [Sulfuritalea sp.]|nr:class I SAM-dependent methyltransferase [Sulfuritalea sp.]